MITNPEFRRAGVEDVEGMFHVRARTRQNPASPEFLATLGITPASTMAGIDAGQIGSWVCLRDGQMVGFCSGERATGEVLVLAVLDGHEGLGIGARLLTRVVRWLRSEDHPQPWLAASPDPRIRAHGFYRALGWRPTGEALENGDQILVLPPGTPTAGRAGKVQSLFVYGTLAPGRKNHHVLAAIPGSWESATLRGTLVDEGWGAEFGCPAILPSADGEDIAGHLFSSDELEHYWPLLDEFEGEGYERLPVEVTLLAGGKAGAQVYALKRAEERGTE